MEKRTKDLNKTRRGTDTNPDPITGETGAHPVGTGVGAASGGVAGAAIGAAVGGPIGAAVGIVAGGVAGGYAGKAAGEAIDPTREDTYWRDNYVSQPWYESDYTYDDYQPAFRTGYEGYRRHAATGKRYEEVESNLAADYQNARGKSRLEWEKAKAATRAAWYRVENSSRDDEDVD